MYSKTLELRPPTGLLQTSLNGDVALILNWSQSDVPLYMYNSKLHCH